MGVETGTVLLVIGLVPLLVAARPTIISLVGGGDLVAIVVVVAAAIAAGH